MNRLTSTLSALACAGVLLAGCATAPRQAADGTPVAAYREAIDLSGRLSVRYHKNGNPESLSGIKFTWAQSAAAIDVSLASPTGQTVASIRVTPQGATLTQANRAPRSAADIDTLLAEALGWSLPVSGLRDWLQGYATSADGSRFVAAPGRDSVVTRDGWLLRYVSWQDDGAAPPRPKRIDAERAATATTDEVAIHIVIDPSA